MIFCTAKPLTQKQSLPAQKFNLDRKEQKHQKHQKPQLIALFLILFPGINIKRKINRA